MKTNNQHHSYTVKQHVVQLNGNKGNLEPANTFQTSIGEREETQNLLTLKLLEMKERIAWLEDVAARQKLEVSQVVTTKNKFIGIIAHDLRGPFSSIICALELMKLKLNPQSINEVQKFLNIASESANRTLNLLDDLLTWTISQNEVKSFSPVRINLNDLVTEEVKNYQFAATQKKISINLRIPTYLYIQADIRMSKTIIRNLVNNAIKFTKTGGNILVGASVHENFVEVMIKDNGVGISEEDKNNFLTCSAIKYTTGTNNETGVGLGLLLCKEFVELHGGKIWIEKQGSIGTEFKFTLPKTRINETDIQI